MTPEIRAFYRTRDRLIDASDHDGELAQLTKDHREARRAVCAVLTNNIDELIAFIMASAQALEDDHPASVRRDDGNSVHVAHEALIDAAGALCVIRNDGGEISRARA